MEATDTRLELSLSGRLPPHFFESLCAGAKVELRCDSPYIRQFRTGMGVVLRYGGQSSSVRVADRRVYPTWQEALSAEGVERIAPDVLECNARIYIERMFAERGNPSAVVLEFLADTQLP